MYSEKTLKNKYKKRKVFAVFLIIVIFGILISSNFVWNIEIIEENGLEIENIMEDINEAGLKIGELKAQIDAKEIINKNKDLLDLIANTLLEYETLTKEQIDYLVEHGKMPEENDETNYEKMSVTKLREIAKEKGVKGYSKMTKAELLAELDEANK